MPTCIICLDVLKNPAALPCGHVFCHECLVRVIQAMTPFTLQHMCPTCKHPYIISRVDPSLVPSTLRQHVEGSGIRRLVLDYDEAHSSKDQSTASEYQRMRAENLALKTCCFHWRKRCGMHAAATLGVVGLVKMVRDHAVKLKAEKDEWERKYQELKNESLRTQPLCDTFPPAAPQARAASHSNQAITADYLRAAEEAAFRMPSPSNSESSYDSDCSECVGSGKRKRSPSLEEPPKKRSHSLSPRALLSECNPVDELDAILAENLAVCN